MDAPPRRGSAQASPGSGKGGGNAGDAQQRAAQEAHREAIPGGQDGSTGDNGSGGTARDLGAATEQARLLRLRERQRGSPPREVRALESPPVPPSTSPEAPPNAGEAKVIETVDAIYEVSQGDRQRAEQVPKEPGPDNATPDSPPESPHEPTPEELEQQRREWERQALEDARAVQELRAKWRRTQKFAQGVLADGLPSLKAQREPHEPAMDLRAVRRVFNVSSVEFEFRCVPPSMNVLAAASAKLATPCCQIARQHLAKQAYGLAATPHEATTANTTTPANSLTPCRYATVFNVAPVLVTHSQGEWYNKKDFTYERLLEILGPRPVRHDDKDCRPGGKARDTDDCHSIREADPRLVGKEWAALKASNLTEHGVETFGDFLKVQVRAADRLNRTQAHGNDAACHADRAVRSVHAQDAP
jgi:hypothetical protein